MNRRKKHILTAVILFVAAVAISFAVVHHSSSSKTRIPYEKWPQVQFKDIRILIASDTRLANQGFAGAQEKDFEKTLMIFPGVLPGTGFTNADQGFGPVIRDLKIVYLDAGMNVLKEDVLVRETGASVAPEGTSIAIEGLFP